MPWKAFMQSSAYKNTVYYKDKTTWSYAFQIECLTNNFCKLFLCHNTLVSRLNETTSI